MKVLNKLIERTKKFLHNGVVGKGIINNSYTACFIWCRYCFTITFNNLGLPILYFLLVYIGILSYDWVASAISLLGNIFNCIFFQRLQHAAFSVKWKWITFIFNDFQSIILCLINFLMNLFFHVVGSIFHALFTNRSTDD